MALLRVDVSTLFVVAGFQVIIGGRFWVITEAWNTFSASGARLWRATRNKIDAGAIAR
jgi:hypothetical protein